MNNTETQQNSYAKKNDDLLKKGRESQSDWLVNVDKWNKFANLSQWATADEAKMKANNLPVITHDFILPCVEQGVSFLTFNSPRWHAVGVTPDDVELGHNTSEFLAYQWRISNGDIEFAQHAKDYYVKSAGWWMIYEDSQADEGRGELKICTVDPRNIVPDPNSRDILCRDASYLIYTEKYTRDQARIRFHQYADKVEAARPSFDEESRNVSTINSATSFTEEGDFGNSDSDKLNYVERYEKVIRTRHRLLFTDDGTEVGPLTDKEMKIARKSTYGVLRDGEKFDIVTEDEARQAALNPQFMGQIDFMTLDQLIEAELVDHAEYTIIRVMKYCSLGTEALMEEELPISEYPLIPTFNKHNGNPYPMSDVAGAISPQEYYNKLISLFTEHTQRSVSPKKGIPRGLMADQKRWEKELGRPGVSVLEYNAEALHLNGGAGIIDFSPQPLGNGIFALLADAKHKIEYQFGIFEGMMGNASAAPETFKGTMAIDEFGQRRMRSKLQQIERSLSFAGTVMLEWDSEYYTIEKRIRVNQPGTDPKEIIFNHDQDVAGEIIRNNDFSRARWDIAVVAGSSTPVNRWAEIESMKELAFQGGIPELIPAIIQRLDIPNSTKIAEQVAARSDLQNTIRGLQQKIREVEGDLQTARRESLQDEKRVELMKFKTDLAQIYAKFSADLKVDANKATMNLEREVESIIQEIEQSEPVQMRNELTKGQ